MKTHHFFKYSALCLLLAISVGCGKNKSGGSSSNSSSSQNTSTYTSGYVHSDFSILSERFNYLSDAEKQDTVNKYNTVINWLNRGASSFATLPGFSRDVYVLDNKNVICDLFDKWDSCGKYIQAERTKYSHSLQYCSWRSGETMVLKSRKSSSIPYNQNDCQMAVNSENFVATNNEHLNLLINLRSNNKFLNNISEVQGRPGVFEISIGSDIDRVERVIFVNTKIQPAYNPVRTQDLKKGEITEAYYVEYNRASLLIER